MNKSALNGLATKLGRFGARCACKSQIISESHHAEEAYFDDKLSVRELFRCYLNMPCSGVVCQSVAWY